MSDTNEKEMETVVLAAIEKPENESVLKDKKFIGHPRGIGALALGNFFNSFAWGGVYALLIYYLYSPYTKGLGFSQGQAASMIAAMGACNSLFIIVGSWLSDRVLGLQKALVIGNIVKGTAFGCLAIPVATLGQGRAFAIIGLVLMSLPIMGASNASLTGQLYKNDDSGRRDAAFTIHTIANAIAGLIAPTLIGFIGMKNYHLGFLICSVAAFLYGLVIFLTKNRFFGTIGLQPIKPLKPEEAKKVGIIAAVVIVVAVLAIFGTTATGLLTFDGFLNVITSAAFIIPIIFLSKLLTNKNISRQDKHKMKPFLKLFCAQIIVATSAVMINTAIAVFIEAKVNRNLFGIEFAPATFTSVYNAYGLILGAFFVYLWTATKAQRIPISKKFATGILSYACSYALLSIPVILGITGKVSPVWILAYYLFMCIGDNLVYPIGNSITAKLAPKSYETQMQSAWSQSTSIANAITMVLFKFFTTADAQLKIFPIMAVVLIATSIALYVFSQNIERGME
jgi:amino acid/peptide transporter (Peptide:H+ symporter), bacterial